MRQNLGQPNALAMTTRPFVLAAAICFALAAASLALGYEPVYDAWAWLVWGRELAAFGLDTSSGPSWKPLTVALAVPLSLAGELAPELWLVLVRAAWLFSLVLAAEFAWRLAPERVPRNARAAAAAFAGISLALLADPVTMWARQGAGGMSEPLLVALVLGAVRADLGGRTRLALVFGGLAALVRPEVWPLLAIYGAWRWRVQPGGRPLIVALAVAVPVLWIAPDLLASGDALRVAERAQRGSGGALHVLVRAVALPLFAAWPLALVALAGRDRRLLVLGAGVVAWTLTVAATAELGFPGLPRFMAPAAAVAGVLGGVGLARLLAWPSVPRTARGLALAGLALSLPGLADRVAELPYALRSTAQIGHSHARLRALAQNIGRDALLRCGRLATSDVLVRTAIAWRLEIPLADVVSFGRPPHLSGAFVLGPQASQSLDIATRARAAPVASHGEWHVYSIDCPSSAGASSSQSTRGVSGALR
ncbi:MAG: hypothetical protein QOK16_3964 [Solirubrobacteraceae bacterium]|nr:hypothetical protein [Solirubrobacteraceae bacterium]